MKPWSVLDLSLKMQDIIFVHVFKLCHIVSCYDKIYMNVVDSRKLMNVCEKSLFVVFFGL